MPGGRPFELIEASRLARLLKEASPLEGLTGGPAVGPQMVFAHHDCSGGKMQGQSIWQPLMAFHGNVGADRILGHLMALHVISWAFHQGQWHCASINLASAVFVVLPSSGVKPPMHVTTCIHSSTCGCYCISLIQLKMCSALNHLITNWFVQAGEQWTKVGPLGSKRPLWIF